MDQLQRAGSTVWVTHPTWSENGFADEAARSFWRTLPESLQRHALAELAVGNQVVQILRNEEHGIVLLEFERGPLVEAVPPGVVVHTEHRYGNYCYDGTKCTFEDEVAGSFLAFGDPNWREPAEH